MHLEDNSLRSNSRWPKLLSELRHLRYLFISRNKHALVGDYKALRAEIEGLAPTLTTLKIIGSDSAKTLLMHPVDWQRSFPQLHTLKIDDMSLIGDEPTGTATWCEIHPLPPTLTSLSVPWLTIKSLPDDDSFILPPLLTELRGELKVDDRLLFPPNDPHAWKSKLPPNLTSIKRWNGPMSMTPACVTDWVIGPDPDWLHAVPSAARRLKFVQSTDILGLSLTQWPSTVSLPYLTELHCNEAGSFYGTDFLLNASTIATLPRTLTKLTGTLQLFPTMLAADHESGRLQSAWPPRLETLEMRTFGQLTETVVMLPRTLKHLDCMMVGRHNGEIKTECLDHLKSLRISNLTRDRLQWSRAPTSLTLLDARCTADSNVVMPSALVLLCISYWRADDFPLLPRTLKKLQIHLVIDENGLLHSNDNTDPFETLPSGLRYLVLCGSPPPKRNKYAKKHDLPIEVWLPTRSFASLVHLRVLRLMNFPSISPPISARLAAVDFVLMPEGFPPPWKPVLCVKEKRQYRSDYWNAHNM